MDDLISEFISEASLSLSALDAELAKLTRNPSDISALDNFYKVAHAIKSTCGFLAFPRLEAMALATERMFAILREGKHAVNEPMRATIRRTLDQLKQLLAHIEAHGAEPAGDDHALIAELGGASVAVPAAPAPRIAPAAPVPAAPRAAKKEPVARAAAPAPALPANTLGIGVATLEQMMQRTCELVQTRNQLQQVMRTSGDPALKAPLQQLSQIIAGLQETILKTRQQPTGDAWDKYPRLMALTRAVQPVLVVEAGGRPFALPQRMVVEILAIGEGSPHQVESLRGASVLRLRDALVPVLPLHELLHLSANRMQEYAVILRTGSHAIGLLVEHPSDTQEVVVTPASRVLSELACYAGAAILEDGTPAMLLDPAGLARSFGALEMSGLPVAQADSAATSYLIFTAGDSAPKAVPLADVARLEVVPADAVSGNDITHQGKSFTLTTLHGYRLPTHGEFPAIAYVRNQKSFALAVDTFIDIFTVPGAAEGQRTILINGRPTEIIDLATVRVGEVV